MARLVWVLACLVTGCAGRSPGAADACSYAAPRRAAHGSALVWIESANVGALADADNARVVFFRTGDDPRVVRSFETRDAPSQLLFDAEGRALVVERYAGTVSAYDPCDGRRLASTSVAGDPVAMALAPDHEILYVVSAWTRTLTVLDAATLEPRRTIELARDPRSVAIDRDGRRLYVTHLAGEPLSVLELDGGEPRAPDRPVLELPPLALETSYMNGGSYRSGRGPTFETIRLAEVRQQVSQAWTSAVDRDGRVAIPLVINRPDPRAARVGAPGYGGANGAGLADALSFGLVVWDPSIARWSIAFPQTASDFGARIRIPSAVATDVARQTMYIASTGTGEIAAVRPGSASPVDIAMIETLRFPSALEVKPDGELIVFSQLEHAIEFGPWSARRTLAIGADPLQGDVARGRRLFYTADDPMLSSAGLACAGCHPDGRDDGLVWAIESESLQTPTLRGRLVPPYQWLGHAAFLDTSVMHSVRRIGGTGIPRSSVEDLVAYLERGMRGPPALGRALTPFEERGRAIFLGSGACAGCHAPERFFADGRQWRFDDLAIDTPSLRGVGSTAPYFHDGRFDSLRSLLAHPTGMGLVSDLGAEDRRALEAYLRTL